MLECWKEKLNHAVGVTIFKTLHSSYPIIPIVSEAN